MSQLFDPITIGNLMLRNRLMRSATAEYLADPVSGAPAPRLASIYAALAEGGIGLIVTGHACVELQGRTNDHMTAMASDELVAPWRETIRTAQAAGARVMIQLNHGGSSVDPAATPDPVSPSGIATNELATPRAMREDEIARIIEAFAQAARRAREAGFDGVQLHAAHGYLVSQFLSPHTNRRDDTWGGSPAKRQALLMAIIAAVRAQVGDDYPVWMKLGVAGRRESQFPIMAGAQVAAAAAAAGVECIETSHALGIPEGIDSLAEAGYLHFAEAARYHVGAGFPLALVSGFRTREAMEAVLAEGLVQIVSLCRPLIAEPDLPNKLRRGHQGRHGHSRAVACVRCGLCRAEGPGDWVRCHNAGVQRRLSAPA